MSKEQMMMKYIDLKVKGHNLSFHYVYFYVALFCLFTSVLLMNACRKEENGDKRKTYDHAIIFLMSFAIVGGVFSFVNQFCF